MLWRLLILSWLIAPAARACETALVLAMDVSTSVDAGEYRLQAEGLAQALRDPDIAAIITQDRVALAVLQWAGAGRQALSLGWVQPATAAQVAALADRASRMERAFALSDTAPGDALQAAATLFDTAPACKRRIIDMSGDGTANAGGSLAHARQRAQRAGITVNALAIEAHGASRPITQYYRRSLITRDGFVMTARGHRSFAETLRRKMLRELARVSG